MKRLAIALLLLVLPNVASAQVTSFTIQFDEAGHGLLSENGGPLNIPDPGFIDANGFLAYTLPLAVFPGDVRIADSAAGCSSRTTCSDGLRFVANVDSTDSTLMEFFSAGTTGLLADTGFPSNFNFAGAKTNENAAGNFTFACGANQANCYEGFSGNSVSGVPEPSTWAMLLLGFIGLAYTFRKNRNLIGFA